MREQLRLFIAFCFYYSGLVRLTLWWRQRSKQLIILNYHRAVGTNLRKQLLFLKRHYRILPLEPALEALYHSGAPDYDRRIPLVLTFDDGYLDNYTSAWQLARELQLPITIFLIPGYIESGSYFWWLTSQYLVEQTTVEKVIFEGKAYHPASPEDRLLLANLIDQRLRYSTAVSERETFLATVQQAFNVELPTRFTRQDLALPLTWDEVNEMEKSGWVSFGAHSMHHPILAYLTSAEELAYEVQASRAILEQRLGHHIQTFCYPVGKHEHIGERAIRLVQETGYRWALTTIEDVNTPTTNPLLLRRLPGDIDVHWLIMASELAGLLGITSRLKKKLTSYLQEIRETKKRPLLS